MKIEGLKEMEKNLLALGAKLGASTLRSALRDAAKPIMDNMIANAPVGAKPFKVKTRDGNAVTIDPGFLKSRIKRKASLNAKGRITRKFKKDEVAIVKVGVFKVPYVAYLEYGTPNNPAHKFIRGAGVEAPQAISIFRTRLKRKIELAVKRLDKAKTR